MKVLYIGHYREGTGWAESALNHIRALLAVGVDVVCRAIKLNDATPEIPEEVLQCESKDLRGVSHVIQHVLPHLIDINHSFRNVAIFEGETNSLGVSGWRNGLNVVDEVWVPNEELKNNLSKDLKSKVRCVPHPTDIKKYERQIKPLDIPELKDKFVFYTVGEWVRRKHFSAFLRAFHAEFGMHEDVGIVIKTNKSGCSPEQVRDIVMANARECKEQLRKYSNLSYYHPEYVFCHHLPEEDLAALHLTCDCFVNTSFGESWSYPTFDAMGYGNQVLSSWCGGMADYLDSSSLVGGEYENCFGADPAFNDIHTAHEKWFNISIAELQRCMRQVYNDWWLTQPRPEKNKERLEMVEPYSYENIGYLMKGALDAT